METPLKRLPTGHRSVNILDFDTHPWKMPPELVTHYGGDPFRREVADSSFGETVLCAVDFGNVGGGSSAMATASSASTPTVSRSTTLEGSETKKTAIHLAKEHWKLELQRKTDQGELEHVDMEKVLMDYTGHKKRTRSCMEKGEGCLCFDPGDVRAWQEHGHHERDE